uniref:PHD-type domain-containing protein n=1 Tax=Aegilops tauschii subsp. strangulata TaxID=200361 RepID=A0A453IF58_AEGTS
AIPSRTSLSLPSPSNCVSLPTSPSSLPSVRPFSPISLMAGTKAAMEDYSVRMGFVDDYICAICDEGGDLICCDGDCGRSFHPTKPTGEASHCDTLGLSEEQLFLCENCESKKHQCFVCGELGSSDQGGGGQGHHTVQ